MTNTAKTKVHKSRSVKSVILNIAVVALCLCYLFPIYIILVNSFKSRSELYDNILAIPQSFSFQYYAKAMDKMNFLRALSNSVIVTVVSILFIIVLASMTAWMLVRVNNKLSKVLFNIFVATMLIPFQTLMMPLMQEMGWIRDTLHIPMMDTLGGLIFMNIGFGASMAVFLFHGFVKSIPVSLEEAATIDGCGRYRKMWYVTLPCILPIIVVMYILQVGNIMNAGFDQIFNLYNPAIYSVSDILDTYAYRVGIGQGLVERGAALGLFKTVINFALLLSANFIVKKINGIGLYE